LWLAVSVATTKPICSCGAEYSIELAATAGTGLGAARFAVAVVAARKNETRTASAEKARDALE
jgi:hypothetical protein